MRPVLLSAVSGNLRWKYSSGPIATAGGLVFTGASKDSAFHAFASRTGEELWSTKLEEIAQSVPITWQARDNVQYVAIAAGSKLLTFRLPASEKP